MVSGAFGPTVNCANRCEVLSNKFKADIIVTEQTILQLSNPGAFMFRFLGKEQISGFSNPIGIYEVFNANAPECREEKLRNSAKLNQVIEAIQQEKSWEVKELLQELASSSNYDQLPHFLQNQYFSQPKNKFYLSDN